MRQIGSLCCALAIVVAGCASAKKNGDDGGGDGAGKRRAAHEVVSGAGVLRGGTVRAVVTVGGPLTPRGAHRQGVVQP